jgi:tetratricopeptide (TPR) repeat protein
LYREVLASASLDHANAIRAAEGLYRARDFAGALAAFDRAGAFRRGEEPYRYYVAVASYETGQYERAKRELTAALPYIEITPDVSRYRTRIEGAMQ